MKCAFWIKKKLELNVWYEIKSCSKVCRTLYKGFTGFVRMFIFNSFATNKKKQCLGQVLSNSIQIPLAANVAYCCYMLLLPFWSCCSCCMLFTWIVVIIVDVFAVIGSCIIGGHSWVPIESTYKTGCLVLLFRHIIVAAIIGVAVVQRLSSTNWNFFFGFFF